MQREKSKNLGELVKKDYCRHKERCAYTHTQNGQSQDILNKAMLILMLRQHEETAASTKKVDNLAIIVQKNQNLNKENKNILENIPNQEKDKHKHIQGKMCVNKCTTVLCEVKLVHQLFF